MRPPPLVREARANLWNSFVSALSYLSPTAASPTPLILSAGGDTTLQTFDLSTGALFSRFPIEELLLPYVVVAPYRPPPIMGKKRPAKKAKKVKEDEEKMEVFEAVEEGEEEDELVEEVLVEEAQGEEEGGEGKGHWKGKIAKGLAVIKIVQVGERESGGVVVLATGCVPLALGIFLAAKVTRLFDAAVLRFSTYPTLSLSPPPPPPPPPPPLPPSSTSCTPSWTCRPPPPPLPSTSPSTCRWSPNPPTRQSATPPSSTTPSSSPPSPLSNLCSAPPPFLVRSPLLLALDALTRLPVSDSLPLPTSESLYPVLSLLHQPEQSGAGEEIILREESGKKIVEEGKGSGGQSGKRAKGRAEAKRRADEAGEKKRKAEEMVEA